MTDLLIFFVRLTLTVALPLLFLRFVPLGLWVAAASAGASVGITTLIAMRLRGVPPEQIVGPRIQAAKAGIHLSVEQLEQHYQAGRDLTAAVAHLIAAHADGQPLTFDEAALRAPQRA